MQNETPNNVNETQAPAPKLPAFLDATSEWCYYTAEWLREKEVFTSWNDDARPEFGRDMGNLIGAAVVGYFVGTVAGTAVGVYEGYQIPGAEAYAAQVLEDTQEAQRLAAEAFVEANPDADVSVDALVEYRDSMFNEGKGAEAYAEAKGGGYEANKITFWGVVAFPTLYTAKRFVEGGLELASWGADKAARKLRADAAESPEMG